MRITIPLIMACSLALRYSAVCAADYSELPIAPDGSFFGGRMLPFGFGGLNHVPLPDSNDVKDMEKFLEHEDPDWKEGSPIEVSPESYTDQNFINMIRKSTEALKANPKDAGAYTDLAYANRNLDNYSKGLIYSSKAIELVPGVAVAFAERALNFHCLDQNRDALKDLERAIEIDPNNSAFYSHRGWIYLDEKDYKKAVDECTRSIQIYSGYSPAFYCRGVSHLKLHEYKEAIADFTEAIKLFPNEMMGYYVGRADSYLGLREYDKAIIDLRTAIKIDRKGFPGFLSRTLAKKTFGVSDEVFDLSSALNQSRNEATDLLCIGLLKRVMKDNSGGDDDALRNFNQAIKLAPNNADIYRARGYVYCRGKKDFTKGIADFTKAIELNPKDARAFQYRANAYLERKDTAKAIEDLSQLLKVNPQDSRAYMLRAAAYTQSGQTEKAEADRKACVDAMRDSFAKANVPAAGDFERLLQRDLDKYFTRKLGKPVRVEHRLLSTDQAGMRGLLPQYCCWVKIFENDRLIDEGASGIGVHRKKLFFVSAFLKVADIKADPASVYKTFPESVTDEIFESAGVVPPPKKLENNSVRFSS